MNLSGKIALVTGGTGALGSVITRRLKEEGAEVWVTCRSAEEESRAVGLGFRARQTDMTDESAVQKLFHEVKERSSRVDIVVHTVGGYAGGRNVRDVQLEEWDRMLKLNLTSAFLCTREALRTMDGASYGRIILVSAMAGLSPIPGRAPYSISKAGVSMLADIVAREVKGKSITVNAVAPSIILTDANRDSMPDADQARWVTPGEIAALVVFLCSEEAGGVTGTTVKAYGGV